VAGAQATETERAPSASRDVPASLGLLRSFQLVVGDRKVLLPPNCQRVLALVGLSNAPLRRTYIAGVLWPERSDDRALANLRSVLWRLRQPAPPVVSATAGKVELARDVVVDVRSLRNLTVRILDPAVGLDDLDLHVTSLEEDLLPDWYDDWIILERERLRHLRLHALERLAERFTDAQRFPEAVQAAFSAIAGEPLRETAWRALIRALVQEGNRAEALRHYHSYCRLLRTELDIEPSPALGELLTAGLR
jgi:DNA-binding SARP family transcriptional activator